MGVYLNNKCIGSATVILGDGEEYNKGLATGYELGKQVGTIKIVRVTLTADGWERNKQTVEIEGVTESSIVNVSQAETNAQRSEYRKSGIMCVSQSLGALEFNCFTTPTVDIDVNIAIINENNIENEVTSE